MIQIKRTPLAQVQTRKQIDIAHDRTQRGLDVVRNGEHQLLTGLQQGFVVAIGRFELAFVTVAAVHVPPEDSDEEQHHQQRSGSTEPRMTSELRRTCSRACIRSQR